MNKRVIILGWAWLLSASVSAVQAEEVAPRITGKMSAGLDVWQGMWALLLVLSLLFVCAWLLRKSAGMGLLNQRQLAVITGVSLGMREKLVLVKVGEKQLLLGVTAGRIDKLLELEGEQRLFLTQDHRQDPESFEKKLLQFLQSKNHG